VGGGVADQQGGDRVTGLTRYPQQQGDGPRVMETGVGGAPAGQGTDRSGGPGLGQRLQQPGDGPQVMEADVGGGVAGQQGGDRIGGPASRRARSRKPTASGSSRLTWAVARPARVLTASAAPRPR
jgi:hypothetical protein